MDAGAGDFIYIPAGEIHVEENASATEPLVVVLTRNCPDSHVVYLDGGPDGARRRARRRAEPRPGVTGWRDRSLADLLAAHGLTACPERAVPERRLVRLDVQRCSSAATSGSSSSARPRDATGSSARPATTTIREAWLAASDGRQPAWLGRGGPRCDRRTSAPPATPTAMARRS